MKPGRVFTLLGCARHHTKGTSFALFYLSLMTTLKRRVVLYFSSLADKELGLAR
jgi:hypothetical protein